MSQLIDYISATGVPTTVSEGNPLPVEGALTITGGATAANQALELAELTTVSGNTTSLDSKILVCDTEDVTIGAALPAGTNLVGKVAVGADTSTVYDGTTALTPKFAVIDCEGSGDNTLVAAVVGKKIRVLSVLLVSAGSVNVRFESGASGTALSGQMNLVANTGFVLPYNPVGWCETAVGALLNLELSAAVSVDGLLTYIEV